MSLIIKYPENKTIYTVYPCEWQNCYRSFPTFRRLELHVNTHHFKTYIDDKNKNLRVLLPRFKRVSNISKQQTNFATILAADLIKSKYDRIARTQIFIRLKTTRLRNERLFADLAKIKIKQEVQVAKAAVYQEALRRSTRKRNPPAH